LKRQNGDTGRSANMRGTSRFATEHRAIADVFFRDKYREFTMPYNGLRLIRI
jgi:hypothetical protein